MYKIKINRKKHTIKVQHVTRRVIVRGKAKRGLPGVGVPAGGTTNQILSKKSNANYDTEWRNEQAALVTSVNGKIGAVVLDKTDIGLPNVDNTSDANKPISTATQTALNTKANDSAVVHKTGNESISGTKTFADAPVVPTPTASGHAANKAYVDSKGNAGTTVYLGDENDTYTVAKDDVLVVAAANNVTVTLPTPDASWATHNLVIMNNSGFEATVIDHNGTPNTLGPMIYRVYGVIESNPGVWTWTWNGGDGINSVEYVGSGQHAITGPVDGVITSRSISGDEHVEVVTDGEGAIQVKLARMLWNVKESQFGALGDGVNDDTEAIQTAIDVAQANGGGIVYMPAGTYSIDQTIGLQIPSGIHLMGAGMYATLLQLKDGINVLDNIVKAESAGGIVLSDFSIDGQKSTLSPDKEESTNYGVYLADSPESRVERVRVYNMTGVGIHVYNSRAVVVRDCITSDNDYHGYELEQTLDCVLDSNDAHGNVRHGLFVSPGEVGGTGAIGNVITNNMFYNNMQYGIAFGIDAAGSSIGLTRDNIVSNNTIRGNTDYGISIYRVDGVTVTGNLVEKSGKIGIYLYKSHRNIISNNRVIHSSQEGDGLYDEILLEGGTDGDGSFHNMITDNWIETGSSVGISNSNWAIREADATDGSNIIKNNYIPWGGVSGKVQILNVNTTFELVGDNIENEVSVRNFRDGLVITPGADPGNGDMRIDAPFGPSAFRMYTEVGNLQFVSTTGNADWFIGGNNVFSVTDDYATIHNYQIKEVAAPTDGTDAANKDYVDAAVSGVPIGNYVLKSGDTMSGNLNMGGTSRVRSLAEPALAQDAATKNYVDVTISSLVDSAPGTLDTLNELAAALGDDPNFATTMTTLIGTKANDNSVVHLAGDETITGKKAWSSASGGVELYNTVDQTTNYERFKAVWNSNVLNLATEFAGTGVIRSMKLSVFGVGATTGYLQLNTGSSTGFVQSFGSSATASAIVHAVNGTLSSSSGLQYGLVVNPTIGQTSTAGYTALLINPTESSTGSGNKRLIEAQTGGTSRFLVTTTGSILGATYAHIGSVSAPANVTTGDLTATRLSLGNGALGTSGRAMRVDFTNTVTSGTESTIGVLNNITPASNSSAEYRAIYFQNIVNPTTGIAFTGSAGIRAGYFENRIRSDGNIAVLTGIQSLAITVDSSSAATADITTARAYSAVLLNRPSGTTTATVATAIGYDTTSLTVGGGLTTTNLFGFTMRNPTTGNTITNLFGLDVEALTRGGTSNIGVRIAAPSGATNNYALQLSDTGGGAPGGITFGTDTQLYRSAATTLSLSAGFLPTVTATYNLGSGSIRWGTLFAGTVNLANASAISMAEGSNMVLGTTTGTKIGTSAAQKLGFYNATPIVQPTLATDFTYSVSNGTTDRTFDADATTIDELADVVGTISGDLVAIKTALKNLGLLA